MNYKPLKPKSLGKHTCSMCKKLKLENLRGRDHLEDLAAHR